MEIETRKGPNGHRIVRYSKPLFNGRQTYNNYREPMIVLQAEGSDGIKYFIGLTSDDIDMIVESREYHQEKGNWPHVASSRQP